MFTLCSVDGPEVMCARRGGGGHTRHSSTMNVDITCGVSFLSLPLPPPPPYESTTSSIKHTGVRHKRACVSLLLLGVTLGGHLEALAVRLAGWPVERELVERVFAPCSKVEATGRLY